MKIKNKMLTMAIAGALTFGVGTGYVSSFVPSSNHTAEAATLMKKTATADESFGLITDNTHKVLAKADVQALVDEQVRTHQKGDVAVQYDFYTYIYESDTITAKDKAKEVADAYIKKNDNVPFIFVINKSDGSFYFVEDIRLTPYTSAAYLSNLAENVFAKGVNADTVKEFVLRADSTITMSVDGDFAYIGQMPANELAAKKYVDVQNFADKQYVGKHVNKQAEESADENKTDKQESDGMIPAIIAFILAGATICFFRFKKQKG